MTDTFPRPPYSRKVPNTDVSKVAVHTGVEVEHATSPSKHSNIKYSEKHKASLDEKSKIQIKEERTMTDSDCDSDSSKGHSHTKRSWFGASWFLWIFVIF